MNITESSAGIVIFRKESGKRLYLLLHYSIGHWDFVKGHIEQGETETQAAMREAKEEVDITELKILEGFCEKIIYHFKRAGRFITKDVIYFVGETAQEEIKLSFEHSGFKWLKYEEALKQITYDSSKDILKKADKFIDEYSKQRTLFSF